tara:strand:+ start:767 stop:1432 length:666 start_codon:yes stop_codon:yes gene_type:complete
MNILQKFINNIHKKTSKDYRIKYLANKFSQIIDSSCYRNEASLKCLDVGCGDMAVAELIQDRLQYTLWSCIDIHSPPDNYEFLKKWGKYSQFDGNKLPFFDKTFDVLLMSDILHHAGDDNIPLLLNEASRVSSYTVVKDNFESSLYSRWILRIIDFLGNWGYGITVPNHYFTRDSFNRLTDSAGLKIISLDLHIDFYSRIFPIGHVVRPNWQFIALLKSSC